MLLVHGCVHEWLLVLLGQFSGLLLPHLLHLLEESQFVVGKILLVAHFFSNKVYYYQMDYLFLTIDLYHWEIK
jgi:hypothetical protein